MELTQGQISEIISKYTSSSEGFVTLQSLIMNSLMTHERDLLVVFKKVCKLDIILIFALSNKKQQEYGTYTRTNFGNYFELHK